MKIVTTATFIDMATAIHGEKYSYELVEYTKSCEMVKIICATHGIFEQRPNNHLQGRGCRKCSFVSHRSNLARFMDSANKIHSSKYKYENTKYIGALEKVSITCPKHGEFLQTPANHLSGIGCPGCVESKGERKIRQFLVEQNIEFTSQCKFDQCRKTQRLAFDFAIFHKGILQGLIEYQGEHHYKAIPFGRNDTVTKRKFASVKHHDAIKAKYCVDHDIPLLIIPYWEKDNIPVHVSNFVEQLSRS